MIKNITNVKGFQCWGAHIGIKSKRRDLAIIFSEVPANAAAVFTQNKVLAEPIKLSKKNIKNGMIQAVVINSGNANAVTGEQGRLGAEAMAQTLAKELSINKKHVIVSSTGIIGKRFPTEKIVAGIQKNVKKLSNKTNAGSFVANAILTTDTFAKEGFLDFDLEENKVSIGGVAKGSGMIHPNMATMLAFIVTDIKIDSKLLQSLTKELTDKTFNMITVDGDTSTNDMVLVLANGKSGNKCIKSRNDKGFSLFKAHLEKMMIHLAKLIVLDGEGASKFIQYEVNNAVDTKTAQKIVRSISNSNLVKTAIYGRDPNWGRIICAAGNAKVNFDPEKVDLYIGDEKNQIKILDKGKVQEYDFNYMKKVLRESHIHIRLDLNVGNSSSIGWGSDLTTDYVLFNSVYTT